MYRFLSSKQYLGIVFQALVQRSVYDVRISKLYKLEPLVDAQLREVDSAVLSLNISEIRTALEIYKDFIYFTELDDKDETLISITPRLQVGEQLRTYFTSGIPIDMYKTVEKTIENNINILLEK